MPKHSNRLIINLDLLKPQGQGQKLVASGLHWLLSAGRYLIIVVEIIVLGAFLFRFKLDGDISTTKDAINQQIPYLKALKTDEVDIRTIQFQVSNIKTIKQTNADYKTVLEKIAAQMPGGVTINSLIIDESTGTNSLKIIGTTGSNGDLNIFVNGLKSDKNFSGINLISAGFDQGNLNFSITGTVNITRGSSNE